jgi:predicted TIM-barrel fold metal-dependent hydrolase
MREKDGYIGFPPLPDTDTIIDRLVHDSPDVRWRMVRALFRIDDPEGVEELIRRLRPYLTTVDDIKVKYRITIALQALHQGDKTNDFVLVRGKGAFTKAELEESESTASTGTPIEAGAGGFFPVVDFHIHPKMPDRRFLADLKNAGVSHAVILATDTDPSDMDRPAIVEKLRKSYSSAVQSHRVPVDKMLGHIRASLYSPSHVTNYDVADWVQDYPEILIGFGSVNLSRSTDYVREKLDEIRKLGLKGIKLLPYSQFFDPSDNDNVDVLFEYCRETGAIVLSHTGCGAGPFEIIELSRKANPALWEPVVKKFPDVPIVLAHCGAYSTLVPGIWLQEALQLGKKYKNVYADLAAVDWLLDREVVVKEIRKTISFDRILFGTDYPLPLTAGVSLTYLVDSLKANSFLTEKEKRKVLGKNAVKLLRIGSH